MKDKDLGSVLAHRESVEGARQSVQATPCDEKEPLRETIRKDFSEGVIDKQEFNTLMLELEARPVVGTQIMPRSQWQIDCERLHEKLSHVETQRDELVKACKGMFEVIEARVRGAEINNWMDKLQAGRDAITKAEL